VTTTQDDAYRATELRRYAGRAMADHTIGFDECVAHLDALVGQKVSVVVMGMDPQGAGVAAEIIGVLRRVGDDPAVPVPDKPMPEIFGFVDQPNAVYIDRDAFVEGWVWDSYLRITTTFGKIEFAGPINRPDWF
jgi:hypothetical protein